MFGKDKGKTIKMAETKAKKTTPASFFREVRNELKKITWPSRKETTVSTIAVFIMVVMASVFLYFADQIIAFLMRLIMGFGL